VSWSADAPHSLVLLRHAKSDWQDESLADHDRPLSKRGRRDAPRAGRFIAEAGLLPDLVLCSTARRARQTAAAVLAEWARDDEEVAAEYREDFYGAGPDTYRAVLRELSEDVTRVMLVGHNPGLEEWLAELTGESEALPTAAVAVIALATDHWGSLSEVRAIPVGRLMRLWRPKDEEG
jgi:phosphohistidine phosphatase